MANPFLILAALGAGAYVLLKKPDNAGAQAAPNSAGVVLPTIATTPNGAATINIPPSVLATDPDVAQEHTPQVTVTVPAGAKVPVGVATFPDVPSGQTVQQTATQVIPQLVQQATQAVSKAGDVVGRDTITWGSPVTPLHEEEVKADQDPHGTIALAKLMINAESSPNWKTALQSSISSWQAKMGLNSDGKFGPKSAQTMAAEVGVLPLIRYYPTTSASKAAALKSYRDLILTMAANADNHNPALAAALRSSAAYEQGQGFVTKPAAVPAAERLAQATALASAIKGS